MRQRNDTGYPLNSPDMGRVITAGEEFSHPGHITGCTDLAEPDSGGREAASPPEPPQPPVAADPGPERKPKTTTGTEGEVA